MNNKKVLFVFFESNKVGELSCDREDLLSFKYSQDWVNSPNSFPLSSTMELSLKEFDHQLTVSFFENLLPEGDLRKRLEAKKRIPENNDFEFLKEFGKDCAGAIILTPDSEYKFKNDPDALNEISMEIIYRAIEERRSLGETLAGQNENNFSLAGVQDKIPCVFKDNKIYIPYNGNPSTFILKTPIVRYKNTEDSVFNEYFCSKLAQSIGLDVPPVQIIKGEYPLFLIKRYDRIEKDGFVHRVHQQDFCQALGIHSSRKYESQGGPSVIDIYSFLKNKSLDPIKDLNFFLRWLFFNLLIGNNDSHGKNLSLIFLSRKGLHLSPFYDLISTSIYKQFNSNFAFSINGKNLWMGLNKKDFSKLESELDIREGFLLEILSEVAESLTKNITNLSLNMRNEFQGEKTFKKIQEEVFKRINHFRYQKIIK